MNKEEQIKDAVYVLTNIEAMISHNWKNFSIKRIPNIIYYYRRKRYYKKYLNDLRLGKIPF